MLKTSAAERYGAPIAIAILFTSLALWTAMQDSGYRTVFIEEFHSGEAGRAAFLFGRFQGEGGTWSSAPTSPGASILAWLGFDVMGFGLAQLRAPFVLLSGLSIALFGLAASREAGRDRLLGLLALAAFALSPFFLVLRATSLNETLYAPIFCGALVLAGFYEAADSAKRKALLAFCLAFVAGLALFVKPDGALIPAAVAIAFLLHLFGQKRGLAELPAFAGGALAVAASYAGVLWALIGPEQYVKYIDHAHEIMAAVPYAPKTIGENLIRVFVFAPVSIEVYFPVLSIGLLLFLFLGFRGWKALSLPGQICILIVAGFFVAAPTLPLIYWKRLIFVAPALLFAGLAVYSAFLRQRPAQSSPPGWVLPLVCAASIIGGAVAVGSRFTEIRWISFIWERGAFGAAIFITAIILAGLFAYAFYRRPETALRSFVALVCVSTLPFGLVELARHKDRQTQIIGEEMATIFKGKPVVADHNAFRFAGYASRSPFTFVHENDTNFPGGIVEAARRTHPAFVAVTTSYKKLPNLVQAELPEYIPIAKFSYIHPVTRLNAKPSPVEILIYERKPSGSL